MVNSYKILINSDAFLYRNEIIRYECINFIGYIKILRDEYLYGVCCRSNNRSVYSRIPYIHTYKSRKILNCVILDSLSDIPVSFCHIIIRLGYEFLLSDVLR
jgi:hypothetical protein